MHDFALDFLKWMRVWIFACVYLCNKLKMKISFANRRKPKKGNIVCSIQSICRRYAFSRRRCPTFCTTSRRQWKLWKENITCANVIATGIRLPHLLFERIAMHHTPRQQRRWQFSFFFLQSCFPFFFFHWILWRGGLLYEVYGTIYCRCHCYAFYLPYRLASIYCHVKDVSSFETKRKYTLKISAPVPYNELHFICL